MAYADYKHCDVCKKKAFYDANITDPNYTATWDPDEDWEPIEIAVLCQECKRTHEIRIIEK